MTSTTADTDPVIEALTAASAALALSDHAQALSALEAIAQAPEDRRDRRPLPIPLIAEVFQRDRFTCRYCGKRTVPTAVLRAISSVPALQAVFPYHRFKRTDSTHPAHRSHGGTCDHIVPVARGGSRDDLTNLATACWECNRSKADQMLEQTRMNLLPEPKAGDWDGLTSYYEMIWEAGGRPDERFHRQWMRAFDASSNRGNQPAILRVVDGPDVVLGTKAYVDEALRDVHGAFGGSSGMGRWSFLFGFSLEEPMTREHLDLVAREAADFLTETELLLGEDTKRFLRQLKSI